MKKLLLAILTISLIAIFSPITYGGGSIWNKTQTVYFSGGSRTVTAVYADLNDKTIRMESVIARNQLGKVDSLGNIANQANKYGQKTMAAINGTFFYAYYGKPMPSCTIQSKGSFEFLSTAGSVIGFTGDNHAKIERLKVSIDGSINGNYEYPNNWAVWGFNNISASSDSIFTPAYGKTTGNHTKISIVVKNGIVTKIVKGKAEIPSNGYTIVFKNRNYSKKFSVGDKIDYKVNYAKILSSGKKASLVWSDVRSTTGAGPTLVKGSTIIADGRLENFTDSKITTASGQRSFIGVTQKNVLIMGTVPSVTIKQLAAVVKKMGLYNAINLDGGASSGLYYKGRYLKTPGRQLSNALVITQLNIKPVRVTLNNKELFYKYDFFTKNGVLMAPLKLILQTFGTKMNTSTMTVKRGDTTIIFEVWSNIAKVNGKDIDMGGTLQYKSGVLFVPLKFLITTFDGTYQYDSQTRVCTTNISLVNAESAFNRGETARKEGDIEKAERYYFKALELDSKHSGSIIRLAKIYASRHDYKNTADFYMRYYNINKKDYAKLSSSAWTYYSGGYFDEAVSAFEKLTRVQPKVCAYWINLGRVRADSRIARYYEARQALNKALTLYPTSAQRETILNTLERIKGR